MLPASSNLTEEQHQIQELARDFAKNELAPNMSMWDEQVGVLPVVGFPPVSPQRPTSLTNCYA